MANGISLIFLLLEMSSKASSSYSVRGASYQPIEHYALLGQSFLNISGISVARCSARCLSHRGCFSFNYDRINQVCQMNSVTGKQVCDNFQGMLSFSYYDATAEPMTCDQNTYVSGTWKSTPLKTCLGFEKLGVEDGSIPDKSLSASSNWESTDVSTPAGGRLNKIPSDVTTTIAAWCPSASDTFQWIQVGLDIPTYVTGVLTQARYERSQWVTKYKVQFEPPSPACLVDVKDKLGQTQVFNGNTDMHSIVERRFFKPVLAVKIRIVPVEWEEYIALRFELLGCK